MSWWTDLRDTGESALSVAGNYFLPGSGLLTSQLVSEGSKKQLGSSLGQLAMLGGGLAGGMAGNLGNWGTVADTLGLSSLWGGAGAGVGTSLPVNPADYSTADFNAATAGMDTTYTGGGSEATAGKGLFGGIPNMLGTAMVGSSLYDMYAKNQMAKRQEAMYNQNRADILNSYAPGSPEYQLLAQEIARKDAAAGRNSQYGTRANELAGQIAKIRMNALQGMQTGQNALMNQQMGSQYGGLNTLFNNMAMYSLLNRKTA
jgi:hypothetical protein